MIARRKGVVTSVTADLIVVEPDDAASKKDIDHYPLLKFVRSNQGTCLNHRSTVAVGDRVKPGQVIADSMSTDQGELALGQNIVVAYMSWEGANYEDAIIISDRLVREDVFTSIHIEKHEIEARDTKLGPEEITRDIANVPEELLASLDENMNITEYTLPEGARPRRIAIDANQCIAFRDVECGVCVRVCPAGEEALRLDANGRPVIGPACTGCGACINGCVTSPSSITARPLEMMR